MPKQVMLSDTAYRMLVQRKGEKSFSKVIIELMVDKKAAAKDPKKLLEINGIIKTKNQFLGARKLMMSYTAINYDSLRHWCAVWI
jgi:Uncharacterized ACR, COG1753.